VPKIISRDGEKMITRELVSCIITTFNRPDLVENAINSVLSQTYTNIELLVVDDCSTTSYDSVIAKYKQDERVTFLLNEKNMGLSASRNNGVERSSGDFIAFLDDDDVWLENKLQAQVEVLCNDLSFIACSSSHIESESNVVINHNIREFELEDIYINNLIGPPSKILIRSEVFDEIKFDEKAKHAEDWDFYLKLLEFGTIYSIEAPLIIYNTGHFQRMTNGFSEYTIAQIKEKARMTYVNKHKIGDANFNLRLTNYYFLGFKRRKNKVIFLREIIKDVGFVNVLSIFIKRVIRIVKRKTVNVLQS